MSAEWWAEGGKIVERFMDGIRAQERERQYREPPPVTYPQVLRTVGWALEYPAPPVDELVPPPVSESPPLAAALARDSLTRLNLLWQHGVEPVDPLQERAGFTFKADAEEFDREDVFPLMAQMVERVLREQNRQDYALAVRLVEAERTGVELPPPASQAEQERRELLYRAAERVLGFGFVSTPLEAAEWVERMLWRAAGRPE